MSSIEFRDRGDGERLDVVLVPTNPPVAGGRHVDAIAAIEASNAFAARNTRRFQGIPDPIPEVLGNVITTTGFASLCTYTSTWLPGAICRTLRASIRVGDTPPGVLAVLRAGGLEAFLDGADPGDTLDLGEAVQISSFVGERQFGPKPIIAVEDVVKWNLEGENAQTRRDREARDAEAARARWRQAEDARDRRMKEVLDHERARDEQARMQSTTYAIRKLTEEFEAEKRRLEESVQSRIDAAVAAALAKAQESRAP
jgi:hypothetical protein